MTTRTEQDAGRWRRRIDGNFARTMTLERAYVALRSLVLGETVEGATLFALQQRGLVKKPLYVREVVCLGVRPKHAWVAIWRPTLDGYDLLRLVNDAIAHVRSENGDEACE